MASRRVSIRPPSGRSHRLTRRNQRRHNADQPERRNADDQKGLLRTLQLQHDEERHGPARQGRRVGLRGDFAHFAGCGYLGVDKKRDGEGRVQKWMRPWLPISFMSRFRCYRDSV